jgi:hypothetical protein
MLSTRSSISSRTRRARYRFLRAVKNRFGATGDVAIFEMTATGFREVAECRLAVAGAGDRRYGQLPFSAARGYTRDAARDSGARDTDGFCQRSPHRRKCRALAHSPDRGDSRKVLRVSSSRSATSLCASTAVPSCHRTSRRSRAALVRYGVELPRKARCRKAAPSQARCHSPARYVRRWRPRRTAPRARLMESHERPLGRRCRRVRNSQGRKVCATHRARASVSLTSAALKFFSDCLRLSTPSQLCRI